MCVIIKKASFRSKTPKIVVRYSHFTKGYGVCFVNGDKKYTLCRNAYPFHGGFHWFPNNLLSIKLGPLKILYIIII